jgi:hypothetical protein
MSLYVTAALFVIPASEARLPDGRQVGNHSLKKIPDKPEWHI